MTTDVINGVPRELRSVLSMILSALDRDAAEGKTVRGEMAEELRAILATAQPAADETLHCDFCQAETADPWHGSGVFDGVERRHVHACEACRPKLKNTQPAADGEREAFEAVYAGRCNFERNPHHPDIYANEPCRARWEAWQARAAQPQQTVAVTDVSTLKIALAELHKCGVKPGSLPHMVLTNLIDAAHKTGEEDNAN